MEAYRSIAEAANTTEIDRKTIRRAADSKDGVAKNYIWRRIIGFSKCVHCGHINITNEKGCVARVCEKCDKKLTHARVSK